MKSKLIFLSILFLISGCSVSTSDYKYIGKENDPNLEFSADFGGGTIPPVHFSLNIDNPEDNKCNDFNEIGYYYPESSIFILAKINPELSAKVPANKFVSIASNYDVANSEYCYAETKQFMAEEGKNYKINFKMEGGYCNLEILDKKTSQPVKVKVKDKCSK